LTLADALVTPTLALASSHREATKILKDPTADNTDVYALSIGAPLAIAVLLRCFAAETTTAGILRTSSSPVAAIPNPTSRRRSSFGDRHAARLQ
jgi:hypothetical protein